MQVAWQLRALIRAYLDGHVDAAGFEERVFSLAASLRDRDEDLYAAELAGLVQLMLADRATGDRAETEIREILDGQLAATPTFSLKIGASVASDGSSNSTIRDTIEVGGGPSAVTTERSPTTRASAQSHFLPSTAPVTSDSGADTQRVEASA